MLSISANSDAENALKSQCLLHADSIAANIYGTYAYNFTDDCAVASKYSQDWIWLQLTLKRSDVVHRDFY